MNISIFELSQLIENSGYMGRMSAKLVGSLIICSFLGNDRDYKISTKDFITSNVESGEIVKSDQDGNISVLVDGKWVDTVFSLGRAVAENMGIMEFDPETERKNIKLRSYALTHRSNVTGGLQSWERMSNDI